MDDDTHNRIQRLENATDELAKNDKQLNDTVQELVIQTRIMSNILERMTNDIEPRMSRIEDDLLQLKMQQSANTSIVQAAKWVARIVVAGALTVAGTLLLKGEGLL